MKFARLIAVVGGTLLLTATLHARTRFEETFAWEGGKDHSGWKAMSNYPLGYVIAGTKFFEPANTKIFLSGFNDLSQHEWTTTHSVDQLGFTALDTMWKSFTTIGPPSAPTGFFIALAGLREGKSHYYTLQTDKHGHKTAERFGVLGGGVQLGGACQAADGGYIAVGSNNVGDIAVVKFNPSGELVTSTTLLKSGLPVNGFGWTVQPAPGGGYVVGATTRKVLRFNESFDVDWGTTVSLPVSPDASAYSYTEFEEILPLQNTGSGMILTGSAFSNSHSATYSARLDWNGTVPWSKVNDSSNTALPTTPVCWTNSAVELFNTDTGVYDIVYTWRKGPVSTGGTLFGEQMNPDTGAQRRKTSLLNDIPMQEAFTVRQHFVNRLVIAGVRGGYSSILVYSAPNLPPPAIIVTRNPPTAESKVAPGRVNIGATNAHPEFATNGDQ